MDELYEIHKQDSYISAGYIEWQNNAIYEEWAMNEDTFLSTLWDGMTKMTDLRSFVVTGGLWVNQSCRDVTSGATGFRISF